MAKSRFRHWAILGIGISFGIVPQQNKKREPTDDTYQYNMTDMKISISANRINITLYHKTYF